ncbi:MAG: putative zinc-binding protein [Halopseudomonas sp.]
MKSNKQRLPLIYSCSGCSNIAQLANRVAIELDRERRVEMSCIAGVGGGVTGLVGIAQSGRPVVALDGCPLHCVKHCLASQGVVATQHHTLSEYGIKKRPKLDVEPADIVRVKAIVLENLSSKTHPRQPTTAPQATKSNNRLTQKTRTNGRAVFSH